MGSIAETLLMGIGKQQTSLAARLAGRVAHAKGPVLLIAPEAELELVQVEALELERVPVAVREQVVVLVAAPERALGLAEAELELGQVAAPQVHVPGAVVLERDRVAAELVLAPVAVALRIKSVTAAHHPGQARLRGVEVDLAVAAAETTHVPAATEAVAAWAAGVTAEAAVAAESVVAAAGAVAAE
jgi:hypothetical protein